MARIERARARWVIFSWRNKKGKEGMMEEWNDGMMEYWKKGIMECRKNGKGKEGIMECRNNGKGKEGNNGMQE